jgi:hypothetical protein
MIETQIGDNAVDPGVERALKPEAANIYVSPEKSFLVNILAIFLRPSEMNRQAKHGPVVLPNQFFESSGVAELSPADELRVIHTRGANLLSMLRRKL